MKINEKKIIGKEFAYDGCHKIYIIEDLKDKEEAINGGYTIKPIEELPNIYKKSCDLRFIHNWKLTVTYCPQGEEALFEI